MNREYTALTHRTPAMGPRSDDDEDAAAPDFPVTLARRVGAVLPTTVPGRG